MVSRYAIGVSFSSDYVETCRVIIFVFFFFLLCWYQVDLLSQFTYAICIFSINSVSLSKSVFHLMIALALNALKVQ